MKTASIFVLTKRRTEVVKEFVKSDLFEVLRVTSILIGFFEKGNHKFLESLDKTSEINHQ